MGEFVKHVKCEECGSSDAKAIYKDGSSFCFSCGSTKVSKEWIEENSNKKGVKKKTMQSTNKDEEKVEKIVSTKAVIDSETAAEIKKKAVPDPRGYRGLRKDICAAFGVRHEYDNEGEVTKQYYPCTQEGELTGYKIREIPKTFYSEGRTGAECQLFGQFKFNRGGKYVVIHEGEVCCLSAYQMLSDYNKSRGSDFEVAVVSPTTGANSQKQVAAQYSFFDSFENIILAMDNDDAGRRAADKIIKVLPKGKVKIMQMRHKDANEYLEAGDSKAYVQDFYAAKQYSPAGVLASSELYEHMISQIGTPRLPFPAFMGNLNDFFKGGIPTGHIINIAAATSLGKTTLVNELIYYWIFNSPYTVGIVSMELNSGQYTEALLSRHLGKKLALFEDDTKKIEYLEKEDIKQKSLNLLKKEDGSPRFYLLDNRDASVQEIQSTIEELVISCGCKVIVIDVLQDIIAALTNEEQELFLKWSKGMINSHGIILIYVNHTRKTKSGENAADDESNIHGSSSIIKSASVNIMLRRDKMAEDPFVRNKTEILVPKNRVFGITGHAGAVYYDNLTHTLHNFDDFMNKRMKQG